MPSPRRLLIVAVRLAVGLAVGLTLVTLVWIAHLWWGGKSIDDALRGNVEDALGLLQGLLTLGGLIGGAVGLCHGLLATGTSGGHGTAANDRGQKLPPP